MKYEITAYTRIETRTIIEADTEDDALQEAADREVSICVHGTDDADAEIDWVFVDAPDEVNIKNAIIDEY